jgi:hypothetical protein
VPVAWRVDFSTGTVDGPVVLDFDGGVREVFDVNNAGQVVGRDAQDRAVRWTIDVDTLQVTGKTLLGTGGYGQVINESGAVCGVVIPYYLDNVFVWTEADGPTTLGKLKRTGEPEVFALGAGPNPEVVGKVEREHPPGTGGAIRWAILWRDAEPIDLNTKIGDPAWHLSKARGITLSGQIIGEGELSHGPHRFVLTPTQP